MAGKLGNLSFYTGKVKTDRKQWHLVNYIQAWGWLVLGLLKDIKAIKYSLGSQKD